MNKHLDKVVSRLRTAVEEQIKETGNPYDFESQIVGNTGIKNHPSPYGLCQNPSIPATLKKLKSLTKGTVPLKKEKYEIH